ncbi:sulfatase [Sediminicola luteus]|nr:sulfatase [Sediminicola luteus]
MILADDLGQPQLGCYGSTFYQTPNIDAMAKSGIRFVNAYASAAVCSPTRAALVSGQHPARLHLTDFIPGNTPKAKPLQAPDWQKHLPLETITIGEILKKAGYATAWLGKWHLSKSKIPPESLEANPDKQGFDDTFITYKPARGLPVKPWQHAEKDAHNVDTLTQRALVFMEKNMKKRPTFMVLSHNSIHDPLMEKQSLVDAYTQKKGADRAENNPVLGAMMQTLDHSVGQIWDKVKAMGEEENTLLIFYSDNGGLHKAASQKPYRKGKGWLYEGGIRVPLIMIWKGVIAPGRVSNALVTTTDFFPTFSQLAHVPLPKGLPFDGLDLGSHLKKNTSIKRDRLFWNYPHYHKGSGMPPAAAMRYRQYKLIQWYEPKLMGRLNSYELYDLSKDGGETDNLALKEPQVLKRMRAELEAWKTRVGAQEPVLN